MSDSEKKAKLYRKYLGVKIGSNLRLTGKPDFGTEPFLIEIGNNVTITSNVMFLTHDGGVGLFRKEYPGINVYGRIRIGNNVFIGSKTIFLPGVTIGNNVVIGAGSIITKDIPDDVVVAGVPAKILSTIDEYQMRSLKKALFIEEDNPKKRKAIILQSLLEQ